MSLTKGALENLEQLLADLISADVALAEFEVHVDAQKNIVAAITAKLAQLGTLIVPYVAGATDKQTGSLAVFYDEVPFTVSVFQNPKLVSSGLSTRAIAERIDAVLKGNGGAPYHIALREPTSDADTFEAAAIIDGINDDGTPEYCGESDVDWDSQKPLLNAEGKIQYIDANGQMWTFDQLVENEE
jgi:hypothetical protein